MPHPSSPSNRRAHPRIPASQLPVTRVRIPNRSTVSLIDLSSGGALLELPFQMQPESRFAVKLDTAVEQLEVPIQLLRCYVADLKAGVRYHAAGAFDSLLNIQALAQRASSSAQRLLVALEKLQCVVKKTAAQSKSDAAFEEIIGAVIKGMRRGESIDLVTLKVKAHLTQTFPKLLIVPTLLAGRVQATSVQAFGLTFTSKNTLTADDRRLLKSNAQLLSMLEDARRELRAEMEPPTPQVIYSAADWITAHSNQPPRRIAPPRRSATPTAAATASASAIDESSWKAIESLIRKAAVL